MNTSEWVDQGVSVPIGRPYRGSVSKMWAYYGLKEILEVGITYVGTSYSNDSIIRFA